MNARETRGEILRNLARARTTMLLQARRMREIDAGRPDPYPDMDRQFVEEMLGEHPRQRSPAR